MRIKDLFLFSLFFSLSSFAFAEDEIDVSDDTLPIASERFDNAVTPPKNNFSSATKNDPWEKFERGELNEKSYVMLQENYQKTAQNSTDPFIKKKLAQKKSKQSKMIAQKKVLTKKVAKKEVTKNRLPASLPKKVSRKRL